MEERTVAAVSTPLGKGGVALVRVSGDEAVEICEKVFYPKSGKKLSEIKPGTAIYGYIYSEKERIDDGMAVVFRAPRSFTGEDTVEITCHGGIFITECVLEAVLSAGASPAGPGEFTKRAFLSGKLGLSQAEAIADVIDAASKEQVRLASANTRGVLSREVGELSDRLENILSSTYAYIDYPDEDLTDVTPEEMKNELSDVILSLTKLIDTYHTGKAVRDGIDTVILGKPNTGKSSLLNLLCRENRAIVTDKAGTTRDLIEEKVTAGRVTLNLCDTAGIRETDDKVEKIGVERANDRAKGAALLFAVFDCSRQADNEDFAVVKSIREMNNAKIAVINKCDLEKKLDFAPFADAFDKTVEISALTGEGAQELIDTVNEMYFSEEIDYDKTAIVSNARQFSSLTEAKKRLEAALSALETGQTQDIAALDIELALSSLFSLDGREVSERIVDGIFSRFCVGK